MDARANIAGRRALVVGLGKSGVAACRLLATHGARVAVVDRLSDDLLKPALTQLAGVPLERVFAGDGKALPAEAFAGRDLIVVSPGVPLSSGPLAAALEAGLEVIGEAELASRFIDEPVLGVTGTNGKSTTTALTGHLLETGGQRVFTGGNLGNALSNRVLAGGLLDVTVCELSSFQLESVETFRCAGAAVLNVTPDHLDRYADLEAYALAKARIFLAQRPGDAAVLNLADPRVAAMRTNPGVQREIFDPRLPRAAPGLPASGFRLPPAGSDAAARMTKPQPGQPLWETPQASASRWRPAQAEAGSRKSPKGEAARPEAQTAASHAVAYLTGARKLRIGAFGFDLRAKTLRGAHNAENALAAVLLALHAQVRPEDIQRGLDSYPGLPHRLEPVRVLGGVEYVNDSKATNVDSVEKSLSAFEQGVIILMGGRGKGAPYTPLAPLFAGRVKALLTLGEDAPRIAEELGSAAPLHACGDLATAIATARKLAQDGDTVLLSPACASYDQFRSFEDRGEQFKRLVRELA